MTLNAAGVQSTDPLPRMAFTVALATTSGVVDKGAFFMPAVIFVVTKPGRTTSSDAP